MPGELTERPRLRAADSEDQASGEGDRPLTASASVGRILQELNSADRVGELLEQVAQEHISCQQEVVSLRQQLAALQGVAPAADTGGYAFGESEADDFQSMPSLTNMPCVSQAAKSWSPFGDAKTGNLMWPTDLPARDSLQAHDDVPGVMRSSTLAPGRGRGHVSRLVSQEQTDCGVVHPDSTCCIVFDVLGVLLASYELVLVPLVLAWKLELSGFWLMVSWATFSFWLFDFALTFTKGTYVGGQISLRRSVIAAQYFKRWFLVDVLILLVDFIANVLDSTGSPSIRTFAGACRALKVVRILRVVRTMQKMLFWSIGVGARVAIQATLIVFCAAMACHIMCCGWWAIGVSGPTDTGHRWTDGYRDEFLVQGFSYEYTTSLHWVVGQMTLAGTDISSKNSMERVVNIMALVVALVMGSTLISIMSAGILDLRKSRQSKASSLLRLRAFLRQESIPVGLAAEVQRQVQERHEEITVYHEEQVDAFAHLSRRTRMKLTCALRLPALSTHDFWRMWASIDPCATRALCLDAVAFRYVRSEDELFLAGEPFVTALYVADGEHLYTQTPSTSVVDQSVSMSVAGDIWVCEAALWSVWVTVGSMAAMTTSKVFSIDADKLWNLVKETPSVRKISIVYARNFHKQLTMAIPPLEDYPTDFYVPRTSVSDLLSRHVEIDLVRSSAVANTGMSYDQEIALTRELEEEKCCVTLDKNSRLLRTVLMAVLVLVRHDGRRLAEIGRREGGTGALASGTLKTYCRFPGTKRRRGEPPTSAIQRLLKEDVGDLAPLIRLADVRSEIQQTFSSKFGCETVYHKMVQAATMYDTVFDAEDAIVMSRLLDADDEGLPEELDCLGPIKYQDVLMMRNKFDEPVFFTWFTPDEFADIRDNEEDFKSALKKWLEALSWVEADSSQSFNSQRILASL